MINLGFYSGRNMPQIHIGASIIDRVLEGIALLPVLIAVVLFIVNIEELPVGNKGELITSSILVMLSYALLFSLAYAPVSWINFPVRPTERNIRVQYWLVGKLLRVLNIFINLMLLFIVCSKLAFLWTLDPGLFDILTSIQGIWIAITFLVYYIFARKYR